MKRRHTIFHARMGPVWIPQKSTGTCYVEFVFLHLVGSMGHFVHSSAAGAQIVDTLFFILRWAQSGFHEKHIRKCYVELIFLHTVGCVGHVVHSGASGP
jgi:hypothetical protein